MAHLIMNEAKRSERKLSYLPTLLHKYMVHVGVIFTRAVKVLNEEKCHLPL